MQLSIPPSWESILDTEINKKYFNDLSEYIHSEYWVSHCFPEENDIFRAFLITPFENVKVVILGQDPYHTPGAAMWLSFSVPDGSRLQPSLRNIFKELESDLGISRKNTDLTDWAEQGVLLLNSVLTVRSSEPASHAGKWWEIFTDAVIRILSEKKEGIVFVLWGNYALSKSPLIDQDKHRIITSPHPSPFSAHRGFLGSRPFSKTNEYLKKNSTTWIRWG